MKTMAPVLITIHNLRAETQERSKAEVVIGDWAKLGKTSLDMDVVAVKALSYSKSHPTPDGELRV